MLDFKFYLDNEEGLYFAKNWVLNRYCYGKYSSNEIRENHLRANCRVLIELALKVDYIREDGLKLSKTAIDALFNELKEESEEFKEYF